MNKASLQTTRFYYSKEKLNNFFKQIYNKPEISVYFKNEHKS